MSKPAGVARALDVAAERLDEWRSFTVAVDDRVSRRE
jgi:hypothetical protein